MRNNLNHYREMWTSLQSHLLFITFNCFRYVHCAKLELWFLTSQFKRQVLSSAMRTFLSRNIFFILYWFTCLKDIFTFKCIINLCNCWTLFDFSVLQFYSDNMTVVTFSIILFWVYLEHHSILYFFKSNGLVSIKTVLFLDNSCSSDFLYLNGFQISKL